MAKENELEVKITSDTAGVKTGTADAASAFSTATSQITGSIAGVNAAVSGMLLKFGLITGAVMGVVSSLTSFVSEAAEAEQIENRLRYALEQNGYEWGRAKIAVDNFANSVMASTRFSDEEAREALTRMLMYTRDYEKAQNGARLAMDMSIRTGQDLMTTTRYIGMAQQGATEMLGRYIPELRNLKDRLGENATQAEKAAYAMKVLNEKFGGTAAEDVKTYAGSLKQMKNEWGELKEVLGSFLIGPGTAFLKWIKDSLQGVRDLIDIWKPATSEFEKSQQEFLKNRKEIEMLTDVLEKQAGPREVSDFGMLGLSPAEIEQITKRLNELIARQEVLKKTVEPAGAPTRTGGGGGEEYDPGKKKSDEYVAEQWREELERRLKDAQELEAGLAKLAKETGDAEIESMRYVAEKNREELERRLVEAQELEKGLSDLDTERTAREVESMKYVSERWAEEYERRRQAAIELEKGLAEINAETTKKQVKAMQAQQKQIADVWASVFGAIENAFSTSIKGIIMGTTTLKEAFANLAQSIFLSMTDMFIKMGLEAVKAQVMSSLGVKAAKAEEATVVVSASAAEAGAGAAASQAAIPFIGPILAPIAMGAMIALVMGLMSMISASGGWDVDKTSIATIHEKEMVLPAHLAEGVRDMISGGGAKGNAPMTVNVYAIDSKDVARFAKRHGSEFQAGIRASMRNFRRG